MAEIHHVMCEERWRTWIVGDSFWMGPTAARILNWVLHPGVVLLMLIFMLFILIIALYVKVWMIVKQLAYQLPPLTADNPCGTKAWNVLEMFSSSVWILWGLSDNSHRVYYVGKWLGTLWTGNWGCSQRKLRSYNSIEIIEWVLHYSLIWCLCLWPYPLAKHRVRTAELGRVLPLPLTGRSPGWMGVLVAQGWSLPSCSPAEEQWHLHSPPAMKAAFPVRRRLHMMVQL